MSLAWKECSFHKIFWMYSTLFTEGIEIKVVFLIEIVGALTESGGIEVFGKIVIDGTAFFLGKDFFFV